MPPQGYLGRGEACVIRKSVGGILLPLPSIRVGRYNFVVRWDGQVARKKLPLVVGSVKTGRAGAIDRQLWTDTIESWSWRQAKLRGVHVCGRARFQALSVRGALTGAVGFELKQLLLPLTFLQLHNADLWTTTRGSYYTRKRHSATMLKFLGKCLWQQFICCSWKLHFMHSLGDKPNSFEYLWRASGMDERGQQDGAWEHSTYGGEVEDRYKPFKTNLANGGDGPGWEITSHQRKNMVKCASGR